MNVRCLTLALAVLLGSLPTASVIAAQEVVPERDRAAAQELALDAPTTTEGIESVEVLGTIPLDIDAGELDGYVLRARLLTVAPGGQIAVHRHEGRPGVVYFLEGEMVEYRAGVEGGTVRRAGESVFESAGVVHWWRNESGAPARGIVVDALPAASVE